MNRIVRTHGMRLLLGRFDADAKGVTLLVNTDPWGIPVSYAGYALLALSFLFVLVSRGGAFRRALGTGREPGLRRPCRCYASTSPHFWWQASAV